MIARAVALVLVLTVASCGAVAPAFAVPASARDVLGALRASWYDCRAAGQCSRSKVTASGERFRPNGLTAAHRRFAFGTRLRVCLQRCVVVLVNDRGPFVAGRSLDLSAGAARAIGLRGVAMVRVSRP